MVLILTGTSRGFFSFFIFENLHDQVSVLRWKLLYIVQAWSICSPYYWLNILPIPSGGGKRYKFKLTGMKAYSRQQYHFSDLNTIDLVKSWQSEG